MKPRPLSIALVVLLGVINVGRGAIHMFASDGGLIRIADLDISQATPLVLSFIAAVGAGQLTFAMVDFAAAIRFREFVRPLVLIHLAQAALTVFLLFVWRPLPHDVPGQWGALAAMIVIGFCAAMEYGRNKDA